jgi:hypothetical protein
VASESALADRFYATWGVLIEHLHSANVRRTMERSRMMFASLLPVLLLVTSGGSVVDPLGGCRGSRAVWSVSAQGRCRQQSPKAVCSFEQSIRRGIRRLNEHSGPGPVPACVTLVRFRFPTLDRDDLYWAASREFRDLANNWQFDWRTALDARAPSSVS